MFKVWRRIMRTAQRPIAVAGLSLALMFGSLFAQDKAKEPTGKKTYVGTVSDTVCGTKHMMKDMTDAECARLCVQHGGDYALVVGSKIYTLRGNKDEIGKVAGQEVRVTGSITGDSITVNSIKAAGPHK
jgi:hypothetical protein